ncbi:hypothetical protein [Nocardia sp. NPDC003963]
MKDPLRPVMREAAETLSETLDQGSRSIAGAYRRAGGTAEDGSGQISEASHRGEDDIGDSVGTAQAQRAASAPESGYRPSSTETAMAARRMTTEVEFTGDSRDIVANSSAAVHKVRSGDGEMNIYKPVDGELNEQHNVILPFIMSPGALTGREIAAYRIDEILGFGRVPPTARTDGFTGDDGRTRGPGMIQQFVESGPARALTDYPLVQRQQVAVLDYIIGTLDRSAANFRTVERGDHRDLVAIDHGRSFPLAHPDHLRVEIDSPFVAEQRGDKLEKEVFDALKSVDVDRLRAAIEDAGNIHRNAVDGAMARFAEVLRTGRIPADVALSPDAAAFAIV